MKLKSAKLNKLNKQFSAKYAIFSWSMFFVLLNFQANANAADVALTDTPKYTISGISSGGFMAVQMATIYSSQFKGVGSVAGGFFYCAKNHLQEKIEVGRKNLFIGAKNLFLFQQSPEFVSDLMTGHLFSPIGEKHWVSPAVGNPIYQSVGICMQNPSVGDLPDLKPLAEQGLIDNIENLKQQSVYIYQGSSDSVVNPKMADRLVDFYTNNGVGKTQIKVKTLAGGHNFPTDKIGLNACDNQSVPYVSSCQYNLAEDLLQKTLGKKLIRSKAQMNHLYLIDQNLEPVNEALPVDQWLAPAPSLAAYGYLYASEKCLENPSSCRLHVALHGCEMSDSFDADFDKRYTEQVKKTQILSMRTKEQRPWYLKNLPVIEERTPKMGALKFAVQSGYIELAEKNDLMILFPQTWITADNYPYNPKGCWDWYGFTNSDYATNKGIEVSWLMQMIKNVSQNPKAYILSQKPDLSVLAPK